MSTEYKLPQIICATAEMVYGKYQVDVYQLKKCATEYSKEQMEKNKLLIDLYKYQLCGNYLDCEI